MRTIFACFLLVYSFASFTAGQSCEPPIISASTNADNLFSPEQEMVLGRFTEQNLAREFKELRDPQLLAYVEEIGQKLIKRLPNTGLKFKFHIIDYPQANAFNIPGGHVYLTRKLITFAANEDELAAVIGHELGHAAVRHGAIDFSKYLRKLLKVTSVGDEKDILNKYNLMIENARTKRVSTSDRHENNQQLEADKIGFHAIVAAGYDPNAMFTLFDRLTESKGNTGGWFSDLFGGGTPEQKRLREISNSTAKLPAACVEGRSAKLSEEFSRWQSSVLMFRETGRTETVPGLILRKEITPKLRSDIRRFHFSQDGKFLLAQDDSAITVIDRPALKVLFQIPANGAGDATITPDNSAVVFVTENLRFERWNIATRENEAAREMSLRRNCWEHGLSPDGNYLTCLDTAFTVNVVDTRTGKKVWEKKKFYEMNWFEYVFWLSSGRGSDIGMFRIRYSPDSRYAVVSRSNKYRFRMVMDFVSEGSEDTAVAIDLNILKTADLGGSLKRIASRPYDFIDANQIVGAPDGKPDSGGVFSFPEGKRLLKLRFSSEYLDHTGNRDLLVMKPLANAQLGIYDIKRNALVAGFDKHDIGVWNDISAMESASGVVMFRKISYSEEKKGLTSEDIGTVEIPAADLGDIEVANVSDNFRWLAVSTKTRGGFWDLSTGQRLMYTIGYRGAIVDEKGSSVAEFPRSKMSEHSLVHINAPASKTEPICRLADYGARQYGRFVLTRRPIESGAKLLLDIETELQTEASREQKAESGLRSDVSFELRDWIKDQPIWARDFKGSVPRYSFDPYSGRLIFYWWLGSDEGKALLKSDPKLKEQAARLGDKSDDYIVEVVDAFQRKTIALFPLETGKGSFSVYQGKSEGDWLVVKDDEGRVLVYSITSGELRHRYFGSEAALDPTGTKLAVENFQGSVGLYDLRTGEQITNFVVNGNALLLRFNLTGDRLFIFTSEQRAYLIDLKKLTAEDRTGD